MIASDMAMTWDGLPVCCFLRRRPDLPAEEIVENLASALDGFRNIIAQLKTKK